MRARQDDKMLGHHSLTEPWRRKGPGAGHDLTQRADAGHIRRLQAFQRLRQLNDVRRLVPMIENRWPVQQDPTLHRRRRHAAKRRLKGVQLL